MRRCLVMLYGVGSCSWARPVQDCVKRASARTEEGACARRGDRVQSEARGHSRVHYEAAQTGTAHCICTSKHKLRLVACVAAAGHPPWHCFCPSFKRTTPPPSRATPASERPCGASIVPTLTHYSRLACWSTQLQESVPHNRLTVDAIIAPHRALN